MSVFKLQANASGIESNSSATASATPSMAVQMPVYSQSDTVGALIGRVEAAVNSEGELTDEQLNDCATYLDLEIKYRKLQELEEQGRVQKNANLNLVPTADSPVKAPASQAEAVLSEVTLPKSSKDVSVASPRGSSSIGSDDQSEKTRLLESQRFEKQAQDFSKIPQAELQSFLDWMSDDGRPSDKVVEESDRNNGSASENKSINENESRPSLISRANRGFWNAVSYIYPTKK